MGSYVEVICPYCGSRPALFVGDWEGPRLCQCKDEFVGGCDRWFVVEVEMVPVIHTATISDLVLQEGRDVTQ